MMTIEDFMSRLNSGEYAAPTNARRALGRASFSARDKKKAQQAIDAFFENMPKDKPISPPTVRVEEPSSSLQPAINDQLSIANAMHRTVETCEIASQKLGLDVAMTGKLGMSVLHRSLQRLEKLLSEGLVAEATTDTEPTPES